MNNKKILLINTNSKILKNLTTRLSINGYIVTATLKKEKGLDLFKKGNFDLVILEFLLFEINDYNICNDIRKESELVPIIILTTLNNVSNSIIGLKLGANNLIIKPFSPKELETYVYCIFERDVYIESMKSWITNYRVSQCTDLFVNSNKQRIFKGLKNITLTDLEFNIFKLLITNKDKPLSRAFILKFVWGYLSERSIDNRIVDIHISNLRLKLNKKLNEADFIVTIRNTGYMLKTTSQIKLT